ncbi:MAG: hypothetical protein P4L50_09770 [Anaerolineaceae bacterium]|nr:hypothetical protein [Anaerolineaceae bacterium]
MQPWEDPARRFHSRGTITVAGIQRNYRLYVPSSDKSSSRPVPVIVFHGTTNKVVPFEGLGAGNIVPPIPVWAAAWAARNQCSATAQVTALNSDVKISTWSGSQDNSSVVLDAVDNKGHSWPGSRYLTGITSQAVNATDLIWDFF